MVKLSSLHIVPDEVTAWKVALQNNFDVLRTLRKLAEYIDMGDAGSFSSLLSLWPDLVAYRYEVTQFMPNVRIQAELEIFEEYFLPGETLIHFACRIGHAKAVQLLVDTNSDVNQCSLAPYFETPLHIAAGSDSNEIIDILLDNGAMSRVFNHQNETALHCACRGGSSHTAHKILDMNLVDNVTARNRSGRSYLWYACSTGLTTVIAELLKRGANLMEEADNDGHTLLHAACAHNQVEVAKLLISNGASPGCRGFQPDKDGNMPIDLITGDLHRRYILKAMQEFDSLGGFSGLRLRRRTKEEELLGKRFNWFQDLTTVDIQKDGKKDANIPQKILFVKNDAQMHVHKDDGDDKYVQEEEKEGGAFKRHQDKLQSSRFPIIQLEDGVARELAANFDKKDLANQPSHSFQERKQKALLDSKEAARTLRLASESEFIPKFTPSIKQFLMQYCGFNESKAERSAKIAHVKNIHHINKLYDIMQAMNATRIDAEDLSKYKEKKILVGKRVSIMNMARLLKKEKEEEKKLERIRDFVEDDEDKLKKCKLTLEDCGIFHSDGKVVTQALEFYYRSGAVTTFGVFNEDAQEEYRRLVAQSKAKSDIENEIEK